MHFYHTTSTIEGWQNKRGRLRTSLDNLHCFPSFHIFQATCPREVTAQIVSMQQRICISVVHSVPPTDNEEVSLLSYRGFTVHARSALNPLHILAKLRYVFVLRANMFVQGITRF